MRRRAIVSADHPDSISVVFPVYNDALSIGKLVEDTKELLQRRFRDWEIILVDDGSFDASPRVTDGLAAADARVRVIHHERNLGYGGALRSGFAHASKQLLFYTVGDAQYDPKELSLLLDRLDGADVVTGFKIRRSDAFHRRIEGRVYHGFARFFFGLNLTDVDCDFRLFRRHVVDDILPLEMSGGTIGAEILAKVWRRGYRVAEVPVHHYPRPHGASQFFCARRIWRAVRELTWYWLKTVVLKLQ